MTRERLPKSADRSSGEARLLEFTPEFERVTHYLFRYPAKFHPPVVRELLDRFTVPGDVVLDPFCGSGTALVEAALRARPAIGVDIDPLAVVVASAKIHRYRSTTLRENAARLTENLVPFRRPQAWYDDHAKTDLEDEAYAKELAPVAEFVPPIPRLSHWFRRYVVVDLALIRRAITQMKISAIHRRFFEVVFASIIRNASNADPVPVSGLEYTSYMKRRDEQGRVVNPFALLDVALKRALTAAEAFATTASAVTVAAHLGDARKLEAVVSTEVDAVLTSPPYHGAVDYYRRHQLEQFWLGLVSTQAERQELLQNYIGRPKVPQKDRFVVDAVLGTALAKEWEARIREVSDDRANAFKHYIAAMSSVFEGLAKVVKAQGVALFVVGHSTWNDAEIPTTELFAEIAGDSFGLDDVLRYPVKNRYMSYSRGNGASISTEYVLVLRRR